MLHSKFIVLKDGSLILGKVSYHKELYDDTTQIIGGGMFRYNSDTRTHLLFGSSYDFGGVDVDKLKYAVENDMVYTNKYMTHTITDKFKFKYQDEIGSIYELN